MLKKIIFMVLALTLVASININAFAIKSLQQPISYVDDNGILTIVVETEEQYNQIIEEINTHNEHTESLWKNARQEANLSQNSQESAGMERVKSARSYQTNTVTHYDFMGWGVAAKIKFAATYATATNQYGAELISSVKDLDAYGDDGDTTVDLRSKEYVLIDGRKTIAANYSCRVVVEKVDSDGSDSYITDTIAYYVEFYVDGTAEVF